MPSIRDSRGQCGLKILKSTTGAEWSRLLSASFLASGALAAGFYLKYNWLAAIGFALMIVAASGRSPATGGWPG